MKNIPKTSKVTGLSNKGISCEINGRVIPRFRCFIINATSTIKSMTLLINKRIKSNKWPLRSLNV